MLMLNVANLKKETAKQQSKCFHNYFYDCHNYTNQTHAQYVQMNRQN